MKLTKWAGLAWAVVVATLSLLVLAFAEVDLLGQTQTRTERTVADQLRVPSLAQVDLSGQWQQLGHMDSRARGPGPDLADYLGIPLSDEGRAVALSYSYSAVSMTERMCMH